MSGFKNYWLKIYESRYFWSHLSKIDLKNKFRRSKLGLLWICVSPLCLMLIMSAVFGTVFKQDMVSYAPYILSGLLFWNIMTDSFVAGSNSIIGSEAYIRQFNHPVSIYPLKASLTGIASFAISMLSLIVIMIFIHPVNIVIGIISFPIAMIIYFILEWTSTIIAAFIGTKYRDYPQLAALILQAIWYVSPVFFQESMFEKNKYLYLLFICNPITHFLNLIRDPFLNGKFPSLVSICVSTGTVSVMALFAFLINKKNAKDIIFYI